MCKSIANHYENISFAVFVFILLFIIDERNHFRKWNLILDMKRISLCHVIHAECKICL